MNVMRRELFWAAGSIATIVLLAILVLSARSALVGQVGARFNALAALSDGADEADALQTPSDLLAWIERYPERVGLAAFAVGDEKNGVFVGADTKFALASTKKILILGAYAEAVAAKRLDPKEIVPLAAIERWYWPGTDGGAHERARAEWTDSIRLDDVVSAMIRWSDNAATDYVLDRVGGPEKVLAFARAHGMKSQDAPISTFGTFVAWSSIPAKQWVSLSPAARAQKAQALAAATSAEKARALGSPPLAMQQSAAGLTEAGTPREWARLMARVQSGTGADPAVASTMRRHLEWPLRAFARNRETFDAFGTKGGTLVGLITEASYLKPKGEKPVVVALFFRDLPGAVWLQMSRAFPQQHFIQRLATDPAFFADVRARLAKQAPGR